MTTIEKLESAKTAVDHALAQHQAIFTNGRALIARAEKARREFLNRVQASSGSGSPLHIERGRSELEGLLELGCTQKFIAAKIACDAVIQSAEYADACEILEPMIANVRALEAQHQSEIETASRLESARLEKFESEKAKLLARLEKEFCGAVSAVP